jgi:hypothetical protein
MALAVVFFSGLVAGFIMRAVGAALLSGTLVAGGGILTPSFAPGHVLTALALYGLASIAVTAGLVKLGVAAVSTFEIGYGRALAAGLASGLLSLVPLLVILSRPAQPGTLIGLGLLSLPLSLAALLLHAWLVASLAEHRPAQI